MYCMFHIYSYIFPIIKACTGSIHLHKLIVRLCLGSNINSNEDEEQPAL